MARAMNVDKRLTALKAMHTRAKLHAAKARRIALELRNSSLRGVQQKRASKLADRAQGLAHLLEQVVF